MEIYFNSKYTFLLFVLCALIAGIFSFILYRKSKKGSTLSSGQVTVLSILRFLSAFVIAALFLQMAIQRVKHNQIQRDLIIGVDNSESLKKYGTETKELLDRLKTEFKEYTPQVLLFDSQTEKGEEPDFEGKRSDYSVFLHAVDQNYLPSNVGAVLLIGDGIFNAGTDPVYASNTVSYPVYTIGIGDTTLHTDAAIKKVDVNQTAYLENNFPVEIDLSFSKAAGQIVNLTIENDNKVVYSQAIQIQSGDYFFTENMSLKPSAAGIQNYTVKLGQVTGEQNLANNKFEFSVNVISQKQKILILAHGPHPDISAITQALKEKNNYEYDLYTSNKKGINPDDYDLAILDQLPDAEAQYAGLLEQLQKSHRPYLLVVGQKTSVPAFNNLQRCVQIRSAKGFANAKAKINEQFNLFRFDPTAMKGIESLPPLLVPFGDVTIDSGLDVLANQTLQGVEMQRPLIAFGKIKGQKRGFILGEGLWRWRIHSYLQTGSHQLFNNFILKSINYLILKPNEDNFNIFNQTEYPEDNPVIMQAELFNDSYELDNSPDVEIEIIGENGRKFNAIFDKTNDKYQLNIGQLPPGKYSFTAKTKLGGKDYYETGNFSVNKIQIELVEDEANFQVLNQIANKTGGKFYLPGQVDQLVANLKASKHLQPNLNDQQVYQEFLSLKWVFFIILLLLSLEWFLRKFWGIY